MDGRGARSHQKPSWITAEATTTDHHRTSISLSESTSLILLRFLQYRRSTLLGWVKVNQAKVFPERLGLARESIDSEVATFENYVFSWNSRWISFRRWCDVNRSNQKRNEKRASRWGKLWWKLYTRTLMKHYANPNEAFFIIYLTKWLWIPISFNSSFSVHLAV